MLALAVMYAWFMTVWTSNWLDVERRKVQLMLLALMFASLLMSTSVAGAFGHPEPLLGIGDRAGLFVIGYLAIQVGRTLFATAVFRGHRLHDHFVNALVWSWAPRRSGSPESSPTATRAWRSGRSPWPSPTAA